MEFFFISSVCFKEGKEKKNTGFFDSLQNLPNVVLFFEMGEYFLS